MAKTENYENHHLKIHACYYHHLQIKLMSKFLADSWENKSAEILKINRGSTVEIRISVNFFSFDR